MYFENNQEFSEFVALLDEVATEKNMILKKFKITNVPSDRVDLVATLIDNLTQPYVSPSSPGVRNASSLETVDGYNI